MIQLLPFFQWYHQYYINIYDQKTKITPMVCNLVISFHWVRWWDNTFSVFNFFYCFFYHCCETLKYFFIIFLYFFFSLNVYLGNNTNSHNSGTEFIRAINISEIKLMITRYNDAQMVLNEDIYGPLQNDSVIIVVQVSVHI